MKLTTLILFISVCAFAQKSTVTTASSSGIIVTDDIRLQQLGLDRKIEFSKGEALQEKDWQEFLKQFNKEDVARQKYFHQRDSLHNIFLVYTVTPSLLPGDTIESYKTTDKEIILKLKPKKK